MLSLKAEKKNNKKINYSVLQKKDIFIPSEDSHRLASQAEFLPSWFMLFLAICLCSLSPDVTPEQPKHTGQMGTPSAHYYTAKYSIIFLLHCLFRHVFLSLQNKPRHFCNSLNLVYYPRSLMAGVYRRKPTLSLYSNTIPCTAWKSKWRIFVNYNSLPAILLMILSRAQRQTWNSQWISVATGWDPWPAWCSSEGGGTHNSSFSCVHTLLQLTPGSDSSLCLQQSLFQNQPISLPRQQNFPLTAARLPPHSILTHQKSTGPPQSRCFSHLNTPTRVHAALRSAVPPESWEWVLQSMVTWGQPACCTPSTAQLCVMLLNVCDVPHHPPWEGALVPPCLFPSTLCPLPAPCLQAPPVFKQFWVFPAGITSLLSKALKLLEHLPLLQWVLN